jgi:hypothetical protein
MTATATQAQTEPTILTAPVADTANTIATPEQLKAYLITLFVEDEAFKTVVREQIQPKSKHKNGKKAKSKENDYPELSTEKIPFSEMPFWKLNPHLKPIDATPYKLDLSNLAEMQELWKDMPSAEELIAQLTK